MWAGFLSTFRANAFVPQLARGAGGWMMGRSDRAAGPSTPCSAAHARGQDKGIGNYRPDSFILPAVLGVCAPRLESWGLGEGRQVPHPRSRRRPRGQCLLLAAPTPAQVPMRGQRCVNPAPRTPKKHPCALRSFLHSENHWGQRCPPSSLRGGNVSGEADKEPCQAFDEYS